METQYQKDINEITARIIDLSTRVKGPDPVARIYQVSIDIQANLLKISDRIREKEREQA